MVSVLCIHRMEVLATPLVSNDQNVVTLQTILNKCQIPPRLYRSISPVLLETNEWRNEVDRGARAESPLGPDKQRESGINRSEPASERVSPAWKEWGWGGMGGGGAGHARRPAPKPGLTSSAEKPVGRYVTRLRRLLLGGDRRVWGGNLVALTKMAGTRRLVPAPEKATQGASVTAPVSRLGSLPCPPPRFPLAPKQPHPARSEPAAKYRSGDGSERTRCRRTERGLTDGKAAAAAAAAARAAAAAAAALTARGSSWRRNRKRRARRPRPLSPLLPGPGGTARAPLRLPEALRPAWPSGGARRGCSLGSPGLAVFFWWAGGKLPGFPEFSALGGNCCSQ